MTNRNNLVGSLILALCAMIWGSSFVAQSAGAEFVGPFTFIGLRSLLGSAFLVPVFLIKDAVLKRKAPQALVPTDRKKLLRGGLLCGVVLTVASVLQQFGIDHGTSSGKAGFITALYILLVPIFSVVLGNKIRPVIWPCALAALGGLYLLCVKENTLQFSDLYVLGCAVMYAVHILVVDRVAPELDGAEACIRELVAAGIVVSGGHSAADYATFEDFRQRFTVPKATLDATIAEGEKQGVKVSSDDERQKTLPLLSLQMKALIARDLWDMSEYYAIMNEDSEMVKKAVELLSKQ